MTFDEFLERRRAEQAWAYANGYNNGDPVTNGEYACLDLLLAEADLFLDVGANEGLFIERALVRVNDKLAVLSAEAPINQPLITDGTVRAIIHQTFPLEDVRQAHQVLEDSSHIGKVLLTL